MNTKRSQLWKGFLLGTFYILEEKIFPGKARQWCGGFVSLPAVPLSLRAWGRGAHQVSFYFHIFLSSRPGSSKPAMATWLALSLSLSLSLFRLLYPPHFLASIHTSFFRDLTPLNNGLSFTVQRRLNQQSEMWVKLLRIHSYVTH
jgi:hypothetical protein